MRVVLNSAASIVFSIILIVTLPSIVADERLAPVWKYPAVALCVAMIVLCLSSVVSEGLAQVKRRK